MLILAKWDDRPEEKETNATELGILVLPTNYPQEENDVVYCRPAPTPSDVLLEYGNFSMEIDDQFVKIYEGNDGHVDIKITGLKKIVKIELRSNDELVFEVVNGSVHHDPDNYEIHNGTLTIHLKGLQLGVSRMVLTIYDQHGAIVIKEDVRFTVKTLRVPRLIDTIFNYLLLPLIVVSCAGMGCKMEIEIIKMKLKKPISILVGPVCQFICQPLFAFSIAKLMKFDGLSALGLVTVGSCPGGGMSNMITLLIGADLIQSVTMTFTSNICALAMLPLNMFIYGSHFMKIIVEEGGGGASFKIPITDIMFQIAMLAGPVLIGMAVRWKLPKVAYYVNKSLGVLSMTLLLLTLGIGVYSNIYVFTSSGWRMMVGAALLPKLRFHHGISCSQVSHVGHFYEASLSAPEADMMARLPIVVSITALSVGVGMILASFPIHRLRRDRKEKRETVKDLDDRYEGVNYKNVSTNDGKIHMECEIPPSYHDAKKGFHDKETDV
ncbi:putative sodium/bile acid cotransporter 5 [Apostichopus japonicus]|uniref:Putative sodium/bile acid cotransporter 5 n=1 Tax=Stichopus japonicus TaxID=307972 RepID=A0A2G8LPZ5_STIJA|nr:putative sodium/bile acid cotransporter 5 [Apostichopus japonicus]